MHEKNHKQHYTTILDKTTKSLELMHTDLWESPFLSSNNGFKYYISIMDDHTRYTWIFPLTDKG